MFDATLFVNLVILTACHLFTVLKGYSILLPFNLLVGLAFTQFIGLTLFKIDAVFNVKDKIRQYICKPGPTQGNNDEEAALLREREAEIERDADRDRAVDEESEIESVNSITSLPTYGV